MSRWYRAYEGTVTDAKVTRALADPKIRSRLYTAQMAAENFVWAADEGHSEWADIRGWHTPFRWETAATGFVYFIGTGPGDRIDYVKIGFTGGDPRKRLRTLQTGCPTSLTLIGFVFGDEQLERELQGMLGEHHASGEWYIHNNEVRRVMRRTLNKDAR